MMKWNKKRWKEFAFYMALLFLPLMQIAICYFGVNTNSILLAFQKYDVETGAYSFKDVGFSNFIRAFQTFQGADLGYAFKNSFSAFFVSLVIGIPMAIIFSYYIYKKSPFSGFFKTVLFMPTVISSVITVLIFRYFADDVVHDLALNLFNVEVVGLIADTSTQFVTILIFSLFFSFGSNILMYTGAMGGINESIIESAQLDGATAFVELIYIVVPMIWQTIISYVVITIAALFTNQLHLFTFLRTNVDCQQWTIGYYLFLETRGASGSDYNWLSAAGLLLTVVVVPTTLIVRYLMLKFGPKEA